jgi:ABC-type Fe3+ transport system permease subunit
MDLLAILPGELAILFGVPLVVVVILVLVAGRGDDDRAHTRTQARYLAAICLVSLFVALFAAFGTVRGLTDLIVEKASVESSGRVPPEFRDILDSIPGLGNLPGSGGGVLASDDADYRLAVGSALFAAAAAGVFLFHDRRARRLVPPGEIDQSATGRVARAAVYGACFVAALVVLVSLAKAGYGLFRVIAPDVAGRGSDDAQRQLGIAELLSYSLFAAGGAFVFHRAWRWLPEQSGA